jgi:uncharacterized protein
MGDFSRRSFLKAGTAAALVGSRGASALATPPSGSDPTGRSHTTWQPFPLTSVRLAPGLFQEESDINTRYLDSLTADRLLHSFRLTAGISSAATPYGGWEEPACELRGHFTGGHFLSAVALASATSQNGDLKRRGDEIVSALAQCQKQIGSGYLSAFPPELFEHLVKG